MDPGKDRKTLFDLLLVVVENLKLLILGPAAIGLLALAIGYALPQSFTSQAILALPTPTPTPTLTSVPVPIQTPTQAAAMMVSPVVLDPVIRSLNLSADRSIEGTRTKLASQIKAVAGKDGLLRLNVTANSPLQAQAIANTVIDTWLKSTVPGEQDRADLKKRLAYAETSLASVRRLLDRLTSEGSANLRQPLTRGEAGTSIVAVGELQALYFAEVLSIPRALQGLSRDIVVQQPTLPAEPIGPQKGLIAVLAAIGSSLALLLWVFMRQAWMNAKQDPEVAVKQAKLRATLGFKVKGSSSR